MRVYHIIYRYLFRVDDLDWPADVLTVELNDEPLVEMSGGHEDAAGAGADDGVLCAACLLAEVAVAGDDAAREVGPRGE